MTFVKLTASDDHQFGAYRAFSKTGERRGGLVIAHENFGVSDYIKDVCQFFSRHGFDVIAPALFDRQLPGVVIPYAEVEKGQQIADSAKLENVRRDLSAAIDATKNEAGPVGVLGFCWGGAIAYWAACHLDIDAAASVYGARLPAFADDAPQCPMQLHYAKHDIHGGPHVRAAMEKAAPDAKTFLYDLEPGFDRIAETPEAREAQSCLRETLVGFFSRFFAVKSVDQARRR